MTDEKWQIITVCPNCGLENGVSFQTGIPIRFEAYIVCTGCGVTFPAVFVRQEESTDTGEDDGGDF